MYDAGATEAGFPFFAMEYVEVFRWSTTATRTACLFVSESISSLRSAKAAARASERRHPSGSQTSNVLVAEVEGAVSKIIDFGIAKAIDRPLTDALAIVTEVRVAARRPT